MLTSKQRAALRRAANGLDPVFQVGKGEIDEALIKSTADCLAARELIKMKVLETSMYTAREAAALLAEKNRRRRGAGDRFEVRAFFEKARIRPLTGCCDSSETKNLQFAA